MHLDRLNVPRTAREGQWFKFEHEGLPPPDNDDGNDDGGAPVELLIASADTDGYRMELENRIKAHQNKNLKGQRPRLRTATAEQQQAAQIKALAKHVLLGFRGIEGEDGEGTPLDGNSVAHRELVLSSPYVRDFVIDTAEDLGAFTEHLRGN